MKSEWQTMTMIIYTRVSLRDLIIQENYHNLLQYILMVDLGFRLFGYLGFVLIFLDLITNFEKANLIKSKFKKKFN